MSQFVYHAYSWPLYSYVSGTAICICNHVQSFIIVVYYWMASSSTWFFITPLLEWTYNVFRPSYDPSGAYVATNFSTHGGSHLYGLPCPSADSLDPMDHFCTFDVSKIIPKNMHYFPYATFKPILMYIREYDPQTCVHRDVCKRPNNFGVFLDVDLSHLYLGILYALRSLGFDLPLPHCNNI